jgi:hypothetical protein
VTAVDLHSGSRSQHIRNPDYSRTPHLGATRATLSYNLPHSSPVWPLTLSPLQPFVLFLSIGAIVAVEALIVVRTLKARLADGPNAVAEPRTLELVWTVVPAILLLLLLGFGIAGGPFFAVGSDR